MCGICGKINIQGEEISRELISQMSSQLHHRGPDDEGIHIPAQSQGTNHPSLSVGLGHKRLSIIDLSKAGRQPMSNEDKTIWMVFNGEIYNFKSLKKELQQKGHCFTSQTDCEVIIHLYEREGIQFLERLNGMFAFTLWDSINQVLYLCRDRLGIKPLYYYWNGKSLIFASEIKSILADPEASKDIDWNALNLYLTFNYIPAPYTIFKDIKKLKPGYTIQLDKKGLEIKQYWNIKRDITHKENTEENIQTLKKNLYDYLEDAVRIRLIADVPVGAFLSGGIDSSIIVGLMSRISDSPVSTYSIGYKDMPIFDETSYAGEVAKLNHTDHHEIILTSNDVLKTVPEVLTFFDEPFADSSAIPTFIVSRETKKHVKVALSGDGGDELFAGYRMYSGEYWYSRYKLFPRIFRKKIIESLLLSLPDSRDKHLLEYIRRAKKFVSGAQDRFEDRFYAWNEIFSRGIRKAIINRERREFEKIDFNFGKNMLSQELNSLDDDNINRMLYVDLRNSLPNDMLTKVDLMSMRNSLEVRVPFLDHRVVEFVFQMPGNLKLRGKKGKYILLETFKDILPPNLLSKPKWGFEIPISKWLKSDLKFLINEYLSKKKIKKQGIFNFDLIEKLINDLTQNRSDTSWHLWNLIVFQAWYSKHFNQ
ncbi:MAG: asparagine synthase (glutamine-hydrolyzing) [Candidatus Aminicenantes bacterium]|nr:MAG: asparagine synthase (glutamine-hydrolyzing) [Candidatus Aminicenantes bacterium]